MSAPATNVLERIVAETRELVELRKRERPLPDARSQGAPGARSLSSALRGEEIAVIAEFKRRSPSAGELRPQADLRELIAAYVDGGAAALSILTEGPNFGGQLADLTAARAACALPLLRKDFIVDPYQLHEARAAGADAVLLIAAALPAQALRELHEVALELGLEALVEVHDEHEIELALTAGARIIGINNRDLRDFSVDVARTERLLGAIPSGTLVVSESGISEPEQLRRLQACGAHAVLVGETLMRAADPSRALRALRADVG